MDISFLWALLILKVNLGGAQAPRVELTRTHELVAAAARLGSRDAKNHEIGHMRGTDINFNVQNHRASVKLNKMLQKRLVITTTRPSHCLRARSANGRVRAGECIRRMIR